MWSQSWDNLGNFRLDVTVKPMEIVSKVSQNSVCFIWNLLRGGAQTLKHSTNVCLLAGEARTHSGVTNLEELTKFWSGSPIPLQNTLELPVANLTPQFELSTNGDFFSEELRRSWTIIFGTESANMFSYVPKYSELPLEITFWFYASDFGARRVWKLVHFVFVSVLRPAEVGKSSWKPKIWSKL